MDLTWVANGLASEIDDRYVYPNTVTRNQHFHGAACAVEADPAEVG